MIGEILETTKSTKTIRKSLTMGKNWTPCLLNETGTKTYDRLKINEVATKFYSGLYNGNPSYAQSLKTLENQRLEEKVPPFIREEIDLVIKKLKYGKAADPNGITNEQIKYGGEKLRENLLILFNKILEKQQTPSSWKNSNIILIFKKGDRKKIENYRPISISNTIGKIFSSVLNNRLKNILESQQPMEQAGFRKGFSTTDHLHVLNHIIEKSNEYQLEIYLLFIDYIKAFDSLEHEFMIDALINQGVPIMYVKMIIELYSELKARIITEMEGEYFDVGKGVKQGDPLSSLLFISSLEEIFRKLNWEKKGIVIDGSYL
ncbi:unnamed protein product, partial [Allacma fusca]